MTPRTIAPHPDLAAHPRTIRTRGRVNARRRAIRIVAEHRRTTPKRIVKALRRHDPAVTAQVAVVRHAIENRPARPPVPFGPVQLPTR